MASQTMTAWTEFPVLPKVPWRTVPHPGYEALHLRFHTPQARRRNMAMYTDSKDKVCEVIHKLSMLNDLFSFYWFAHEHADFQRDSITGLSDVVSQCINELKEIVNNEPQTRTDKT